MNVVTSGAMRLVAMGTVVEIDLTGRVSVKLMVMAPFFCTGAYSPKVGAQVLKRK
jgi:hypothetical protein